MNLEDRILESENRFNQLEQQRQDIVLEQQKLMGEYRVLQELLAGDKKADKPNKKATTVEAVAEERVKS